MGSERGKYQRSQHSYFLLRGGHEFPHHPFSRTVTPKADLSRVLIAIQPLDRVVQSAFGVQARLLWQRIVDSCWANLPPQTLRSPLPGSRAE